MTPAIFRSLPNTELLGLKWEDIEWDKKQIHIQRTFNNGQFFATKTKDSNRRIDIGPTVINELRKWKLASGKSKHGLVFPNEDGEPIDHHNMVNRFFIPALKKAGLCRKLEKGKTDRIRFHDLCKPLD